jgi:pyruvate dehydrogenase E2 component (dihydrolipoamide acetyltransferase)
MAMEEGTLVNWLVNEGDVVAEGDQIAEIESSKIVNVLETQVAGTVRRKLLEVDETLPVGGLVAIIADPAVSDTDIDAFVASFKAADDVPEASDTKAAAPTATSSGAQAVSNTAGGVSIPEKLKQGEDDSSVVASPHARRLARDLGINLHNITGSGRRGRISVDDIEQAIISAGGSLGPAAAAVAAGAPVYDEIPLSGMRQTIAKRLQESKQNAPHFRLVVDVEIDNLLALRAQINSSQSEPGSKVTVNDMLVKACAMALMQVPDCNVQYLGKNIRRYHHADIAVAVALEAGLITPIIRSAESKHLIQIARETRALIKRATDGTLGKEEFEGGSFTLSNLGMYGIRQFDAIINQPQCAILAAGAGQQCVVVREGQPAVATVMTLSLSLDHRIIDGATGARFLQSLAELITQPDALNA